MRKEKNMYLMTKGIMLAGLLAATPALAQQGDTRTIPIPLSRPGEPVTMEVDILSGEIHIIGEDRDDVLIEITAESAGRTIVTPSGPKQVPGGALELEIEEFNNEIEIDSDWRASRVVIRARVPRETNLSLSTVHDSAIVVENIIGNLELDNVHGPITATGIDGTVVAETVHGDLVVELTSAPSDRPMAFETLHGDIELRLPAKHGAQLHILSAADEVYTDFEVELMPSEPTIDRRGDSGRFVVEMNREIVAAINGGGPRFRLETRYGDVRVLRSGG